MKNSVSTKNSRSSVPQFQLRTEYTRWNFRWKIIDFLKIQKKGTTLESHTC